MAKAQTARPTGTRADTGAAGRRVVVFAVLIGLSAIWLALAMTTLFVGPAEWDDTSYCDIAAVPRTNTFVANRYVHIWTLRLFYLLMESRQTAAGLYSALTVVGLLWVVFFLGRRVGGVACGLVAALLLPFYPVLLKYLTVPYSDEPMVLWGGVALLCALVAAERSGGRARWVATVTAGLCCFLSVKSKETGLAVLVPVLVLLLSGKGKVKTLGLWVAGAFVGWALLTLADLVFMDDRWFSWRKSTYFPKRGAGSAKPTYRMGTEYVEFLSSRTFLAFALLGVAGGLASFRENRAVRFVMLWLFATAVFQSLIASRYGGIHALDRYCVGFGPPLVILGAHWVVTLWRRPGERPRRYSVGVIAGLLIVVGSAVWGLASTMDGAIDAKDPVERLAFFMVPLSVLLLFAVPWLTSWRGLVRASTVLLVVIACTVSVQRTVQYVKRSALKLEPWVQLVGAMERNGVGLARWKMPTKPLNRQRVTWRCRALSRTAPKEIRVRDVDSLDEIKANEWLFTDAKWWSRKRPEGKELMERGWRPFIPGYDGKQRFLVLRRDTQKARGSQSAVP